MSARKSHEAYMDHEKRLTLVESAILNINTSLIDIKQDLRQQSDKIDNLDKKTDAKFDTLDKKMDSKFDTLNNRMWSNFLWLMGMIIGLAGLIAHTQHWI